MEEFPYIYIWCAYMYTNSPYKLSIFPSLTYILLDFHNNKIVPIHTRCSRNLSGFQKKLRINRPRGGGVLESNFDIPPPPERGKNCDLHIK